MSRGGGCRKNHRIGVVKHQSTQSIVSIRRTDNRLRTWTLDWLKIPLAAGEVRTLEY